jgi:hypothetical protein
MSGALSLRSDLFSPDVRFESNRLVLPPALAKEEIKELTKFVISANNASLWWAGDWICWVQRNLSDEAAQEIIAQTDDQERVHAAFRICQEFKTRYNVSFHHHKECWILTRNIEEAGKWLKLAEENNWQVAELRRQIRTEQSLFGKDRQKKAGKISFTITGDLALLKSKMRRILDDNPIEQWELPQLIALAEDLKPILKLAAAIEQRLQELSAEV